MPLVRKAALSCLGLAALLGLGLRPAVAQSSYTVTDLGMLPGTAQFPSSAGFGVNNAGQVVGSSTTDSFTDPVFGFTYDLTSTFLYDGGALTDVSAALGVAVSGNAINDSGVISGAIGNDAAYFTTSGATTLQQYPTDPFFAFAIGINSSSQTAGYAYDLNFNEYAVYWDADGTIHPLDIVADFASAEGISDAGTVVGFIGSFSDFNQPFIYDSVNGVQSLALPVNSFGGIPYSITKDGSKITGATVAFDAGSGGYYYHATSWTGGVPTDINSIGIGSIGYSGNASGVAVGLTAITAAASEGFIYTGGAMHTVDYFVDAASPFSAFTVYSVSDTGFITGVATNTTTGQQHAILLTPSTATLTYPVAIPSGVTVTPVGKPKYTKTTKTWLQTFNVKNVTASDIAGPVYVELANLAPVTYATLQASLGVSMAVTPVGQPYVTVNIGSDNVLSAGETGTFTLSFSVVALRAGTGFTPHVFAGPGRL